MTPEVQITIRKIQLKDLKDYLYWQLPDKEYHNFNGPYFQKPSKAKLKDQIRSIEIALKSGNDDPLKRKRMIADSSTDEIIGEVSWYWKSKETLWLEIGIVIFNERYWGQGIGYQALEKWISNIFDTMPDIIRLGLTSWSGNFGMIKLAEKLGFQREAVYRKARIVNGQYFDSVSYGVLREEWEAFLKKNSE